MVMEHTQRTKGKYLELLGSYNPHSKVLQAKKERIEYWKSQGVSMSPTVNNLLITQNVITGTKVQSWKPKKSAKGGSAAGGKETPNTGAEAAAPATPATPPSPQA